MVDDEESSGQRKEEEMFPEENYEVSSHLLDSKGWWLSWVFLEMWGQKVYY